MYISFKATDKLSSNYILFRKTMTLEISVKLYTIVPAMEKTESDRFSLAAEFF
jgi:hypothetical protein